jgi:hypothetical protein
LDSYGIFSTQEIRRNLYILNFFLKLRFIIKENLSQRKSLPSILLKLNVLNKLFDCKCKIKNKKIDPLEKKQAIDNNKSEVDMKITQEATNSEPKDEKEKIKSCISVMNVLVFFMMLLLVFCCNMSIWMKISN